jgi:signal transduction histidine kinase
LATASPFDAALRNVLDRLHSASRELARYERMPELGERSIDIALTLTGSTEAVLVLGSAYEGYGQVFSRSSERARRLSDGDAMRILVAAGIRAGSPPAGRTRAGMGGWTATMGAHLRLGDRVIGAIAVARPSDYLDADRQALSIFASQVAHAVDAAQLRNRQQALEPTLRRKGERDRDPGGTEERLRTAERVERAHELAVEVMLAVSSHAVAEQSLTDFYHRLAGTVAELVGADKVLFWRVDEDRMLAPAGGYGVDDVFLVRLTPIRCDPSSDDLASKVVYRDLIFRANSSDEFAEFDYVLKRLSVGNAISVPWRAGEKRLGLVAAYDSRQPGGFSREDTWVLQKAGLAAGLVTQLWHAQEDLRKSVDRLTKVDSARQLLLKNMSTVVEKERKRFVSELHDDALQKLTAAELELGRAGPDGGLEPAGVTKLRSLLAQTETSLRRLVFDVRPPALESQDGLAQSIRDRVAMLSRSGIEPQVDVDVPSDLSLEHRALLFRQIGEAVNNVERHSDASRLRVSLRKVDDGILGVVDDDGKGFNVAERSNLPGHLGLLALRERALMAGGWYKIESQPGNGTHVEFWIPISS